MAAVDRGVEPLYPTSARVGRQPVAVPRRLRMVCLQQWYGLADEALEDALYDSQALRDFFGIDLSREPVPDATTLLKFRRLLLANDLTRTLFGEINAHLAEQGLLMRAGTIVDATIIAAPSSTKNAGNQHDPEIGSERRLSGRVEVDDAYLGGQRSGGKAGRGFENKVPFVVAVQTTEDGRPHLACLSARPFTKAAMEDFIAASMALPPPVISDGLGCFTVAASMGAVHDREVTGGGRASVLNEKFHAVNTLISNVKTALTGTYHAINFAKYGWRYLAEVQFRFNRPALRHARNARKPSKGTRF